MGGGRCTRRLIQPCARLLVGIAQVREALRIGCRIDSLKACGVRTLYRPLIGIRSNSQQFQEPWRLHGGSVSVIRGKIAVGLNGLQCIAELCSVSRDKPWILSGKYLFETRDHLPDMIAGCAEKLLVHALRASQ